MACIRGAATFLLFLQIFIEQVQWKRWIDWFLNQFNQVICVSRQFTDGWSLITEEFLFQIMSNLKMCLINWDKFHTTSKTQRIGLCFSFRTERWKYLWILTCAVSMIGMWVPFVQSVCGQSQWFFGIQSIRHGVNFIEFQYWFGNWCVWVFKFMLSTTFCNMFD